MSGLVAALVAGLAGLGSIYLHTERVSPESHLLYTQHLRGLRETDALIDAELLANRLELSRNYDELTRQTAKAQADARHVGTPPDYLSAADTLSLRDDARALLATVMAKSELIDRFKREDSVARNSLAYFPVAASRLIDQPQPDSGQAGHGLISRYIRLVLAFSRQPDERHAEELAAMRAELGRIQLPASMQGRLDNLLLHGDKIMEVLPRLDRLTKEILALPTRGQLEHLNRNYGTAYSNALVLAGHFRNLLYTLSILLALFLAWTFASLLRTQRSLRKTHAELSQRLVAQSAAEKQLKLHATAFRNAHDGITLTDARGNILDVNPAFSRITGWERSEVIGRNPRVLKSGRHDAAFYESMWKSIQETGNWCGEIWNRNKYGEVYPELLSISAVHDETSGQLTNFVAVFSDIRRLKFQEHQLAQMAYYDPLTELPNRTLLADRFAQAIAYTRRSQSLMAICYLDLDGFKPINDRWGHEAGDRVLLEISQRLKQALRGNDTIARIGGDEFTLLLLGLNSQEECEEILRRLLGNIEQPLSCLPEPESVSASIGVTLFPLDDEEPDTLLRHADQAMYQAKQAGKRTFHVFDAAKDRNLRQRLDRLARIRQALENEEFLLYYQPKVDMRAGTVIGAEALIRWQHPERGLLAPIEFLPLIEGDDLVRRLGNWVIERALSQLETWQADGLNLQLSVNIAGQHLQSPGFVQALKEALQRHPGVAQQLELEVLETAALEDVVKTSRVIDECKTLGVHFSLDDFGTGYSSLTYLKRLPAETIKIDQSFVRDILHDCNNLAIVQGVIGLANAFQRTVIAEGVESIEHGRILLQLNCNLAQGYGIARPMPAAQFPDWLRHWKIPALWADIQNLYWKESDYPVFAAEVEHRNWVAQLVYAANEGIALPSCMLSGENLCAFGQWYHHQGQARYGGLPAFAAIEAPHCQLHAMADQIDHFWRNGTPDKGKALIPDILTVQTRMLEALHALQMAVAMKKHGT
ncbi:EAL domain-containing protein [Laribacter hongkongensis]|uniref:EAL domain-containing protein n=1 Tax=Laribacter hongkongensis TaxID=168471 RepID=UPI001EFEE1F7|nr:EAL domain-containing protein [Laribacter hongkongensis]MCG9081368.1 EAL domain-containing protein [Laribacter hongkongensis]